MDITNAIEQVRSKLGEEKSPEVENELTEISTSFGKMDREVSELQGALKSANHESMTRRIELNKVNQRVTELETKNEELTKDSTSDELQKEVDALRDFKSGIIQSGRDDFVKGFAKITSHSNFEKAIEEFVLPEKNAEGDYDFKKVSADDMDKNVEALERLNRIDYFALAPDKKNVHGNNSDGMPESWESMVRKTSSLKELEALQQKEMPS